MTYTRYIPSPPLAPYINHFYHFDAAMPYPREQILPLPGLDLKFNFGGALRVFEADYPERFASFTESWCVGLWNASHIVDWPLNMQLFGVNLKPGGASAFLQLPLFELHNKIVSLDAIWGNFAAEIRERLYGAPTIQAGFALLEQLLLTRLCEPPRKLNAVQFAINEIARQHGALSIRALSDQMGISQNHLLVLFKRLVGIPPKELARLCRFEHVLRSIDLTQSVDWTHIAYQTHYYDQSHLNKDFMAFTGHSPSSFLRLRRQVHTNHPHHAQILRNLPTD